MKNDPPLPLSVTMSPWLVRKPRWHADWAAARKQVSKSSRPNAIEIAEKSKYTSREKTRLQQLVEDIEKAKSVLEARTVSLQREESRLAELRAELVSVPANMDVDASELGNQPEHRDARVWNLRFRFLRRTAVFFFLPCVRGVGSQQRFFWRGEERGDGCWRSLTLPGRSDCELQCEGLASFVDDCEVLVRIKLRRCSALRTVMI